MSCRDKATRGKAVTAVCSLQELVRVPGTNAADPSQDTFSKCSSRSHTLFQGVHSALLAGYVNVNSQYVEVVSKSRVSSFYSQYIMLCNALD